MVDTGSYQAIWSFPLTNIKWHSVTLPYTMTTPTDQTLYRTRPFTEFWEVSIEHLRRVWHADRGRLLLRTPGPVPLGLAFVLLVDTNPFSKLVVILSGLCYLNIPRYFLDFASYYVNFRLNNGSNMSSVLACSLRQFVVSEACSCSKNDRDTVNLVSHWY